MWKIRFAPYASHRWNLPNLFIVKILDLIEIARYAVAGLWDVVKIYEVTLHLKQIFVLDIEITVIEES